MAPASGGAALPAAAGSVFEASASRCTIVGTRRADVLVGTRHADVICGLGGRDVLSGGGGADVLRGGGAGDWLYGGRGNDVVSGGGGKDEVHGGPGRDIVDGGAGRDRLSGDAGIDLADYGRRVGAVAVTIGDGANDGAPGERDDVTGSTEGVRGGAGNDALTGDAGANELDGGAGDDTIVGGAGNDALLGRAGADMLEARDGAGFRDTLACGSEADVARSDREDVVDGECEGAAPSDLTLSASRIAENQPAGTAVGTLASADPDPNDSHTYSLVPGPGALDNDSFTVAGGTLRTAAAFDFEGKDSYWIRVRTTDSGSPALSLERVFTIVVTNVNEAPSALSLSGASVAENQPAGTAVGTLSATDEDAGDTHTFALVSGAGDADNGSFQVEGRSLKTAAPFDFEGKATYSLRVRATDAGGAAFTRALTVTVTDANDAPTNLALSSASVAENQPAGTAVGTLSATDQDAGDTQSFALVSGTGDADNASFQVEGQTLKTAAVFDFEGRASYSLRVRATDAGGATFTKALTVTVTDRNDAPTNLALSNSSVAENAPSGTAVGTLSATDEDAGDTHAFALVSGTGDADNGSFTLAGGTLRTAAIFDFEAKTSYSIRVRTTDSGSPALSFERVLTVAVTNVNEAPSALALSDATVAENAPAGTSVGTLAATDEDAGDTHTFALVAGAGDADNGSFQIDGHSLKTAAVFDFETKSSYSLRVQATDGGGATFAKAFTVTVTDGNEPPTVTPATFSLAEGSANGSAVGTVTFADADAGQGHAFVITGGNTGDAFAIDTASGAITVATSAALDYETKPSYDLTVSVTDDGAPPLSGSATITVDLANVNEAPAIADRSFSLDEMSANGTSVGTIPVSDPDAGDTHAFSITAGNTGGAFAIDPATGEITVAASSALDHETNPSFSLTVKVEDAGSLSDTAAVTVDVNDVNEAPTAANDSYTADGTGALTINAPGVLGNDTDPEGDTLAAVVVATTTKGTLTPDGDGGGFRYQANPGASGNDTFTYKASDGALDSNVATVTITLNSSPVATDDSYSLDEDGTLTANGVTPNPAGVLGNDTDADGDPITATRVDDADHGTLNLNANGTFTYTPNMDFFGTDTFTYKASDGIADSNTATVTITVNPVNDGPHPDNIEFTTLSYMENDPATQITATTTVTDVDSSNFDTGALAVDFAAGGTADDRLEIRNDGNGAGQIGVSGATVSYEGTAIGSFTGGTGTTDLVVLFNANATPAATQALIRAVTYRNVSDNPSTANRTVRFLVDDGDGAQVVTGRLISVTAVNDIPVVNLDAPAGLTYTENAGFQSLFGAAATVTDVDSATLDSLTVTISSGFDATFDTLELNTAGFNANFSGGALTITKAGGTPADFTTALRNVRFRNTDDDPDNRDDGTANPSAADRTVTAVADDGPATSAAVTRNVTITPVNDAPGVPSPAPSVAGVRNTTLVAGTNSVTAPKVTRTIDLKGNSVDPDGLESAIAAVSATAAATAQGGRITLDSTGGNVVYEPPASVTIASDTYAYQLTDGTTPSASITFTVNLSGEVWYVADGAPTPRDGTSARPFDTLAGALAVATTNDAIHVQRAPGDGTLTGGVTLQAGQKLLGEGVALTGADVGASGSPGTLFAAGTRPVLTATNADVISLAAGNEIRGVNIDPQGTGGGIAGGAGDAGGTIADVDVNDAGTVGTQPGLELNGTSGTFNVSNFSVTNSATGVLLNNAGTVDFGTTTIASAGARGLDATGTNMGTSTFDAITAAGVLMLNTSGTTVFGDGTGFDLDLTTSSGAAFDLSNAGSITVGAGGTDNVSASGGPAIDVRATAGAALAFDDVRSTNSTGDGIDLAGLGTGGGAGTFSAATGAITGAAGIAFDLDGGSGDVTYPGAIGNGPGSTAEISGRTGGTVTLSGPISETGDADATQENGGIALAGNSGGSTIVSNATKTFSTGEDHAIVMGTSDGHTLTLSGGGLDIDTTTGKGLEATTSGTLDVTGSSNTIDNGPSTTNKALNVTDTDVGATPLTFEHISSNGSGGGIQLSNTGTNGALAVTSSGSGTCTGADQSGCTGGRIQNTSGADSDTSATPAGTGIVLNNTSGISLTRVHLNDHSNYGIRGSNVNGFTFANSVVNGTNGTNSLGDFNESSMLFDNPSAGGAGLVGSASFTNSHIQGGLANNVWIKNESGTLNRATFDAMTIGTTNGDGIMVEGISTGTATTNVTVQNSRFTAAAGDLFQMIGSGTGGSDLDFTGNTLSNSHPAIATGGGGVTISGGGGSAGHFDVDITGANTFRDSLTNAITLQESAGAGSMNATVTGAQIGVAATANSGSLEGSGIQFRAQSDGVHPVNATATIANNQIRQYNNYGIDLQAGTGVAGNGNVNLTVTGNTISNPGNNASISNIFQGIHLNNGVAVGDAYTTCAHISGNTASNAGRNGGHDIRVRQRQSTTVRLPGYTGASTDTTAVANFLKAQNTAVTTSAAVEVPPGGGFLNTSPAGSACPT